MTTPFARRRRAVLARLGKSRLGSLLITRPASWYYLTGFTGDSGALVVSRRGTTLITDGRFMSQAREETAGVGIVQQRGSLVAAAGDFLKSAGGGKVGFDASHVTVGQLAAMRKAGGARTRWIPSAGLVEELRSRKDPRE
ncbi:MAG: aminopeptidase P family N-terminal domain-containing protein, partial [Candidatus Acidiferrum sp.]